VSRLLEATTTLLEPTTPVCGWCRELLRATRADARFCGPRCRQSAFRLRRRRATVRGPAEGALRFAYADPPYPGKAAKYYADQPTYAGEVDHRALVASLEASGYAGWALSTSRDALRWLLPLCPEEAIVAPWVKPIGASSRTFGPHNCWEPLIVVPGRRLRGGVRDWLRAQPARGGGTLPGRKPIAFCAWLFDLLGMQPGDELVDLFPGTGVVGRAWAELSLGAAESSSRSSTTAPVAGVLRRRVARAGADDVSPMPSADTSPRAARHASPAAAVRRAR